MNVRFFIALPMIMLSSGCLTRPRFVPVPTHVFSQFEALREPRTDLPVGALWIDGYGPTGEAAASDNLVTTKSLTGITFDNGFQASLTLGLLKFLDLDPSYSRKMTAHFGDLSIVRVKDFSKLSGPDEQPRIYEGLKAGSITITAIGNAGLDIQNRALSQDLQIFGRGTTALAKTFTIDGRDMFIAIEVASLQKTVRLTAVERINAGQKKTLKVGPVEVELMLTGHDTKPCANEAIELRQAGSDRPDIIKIRLGAAPESTMLRLPVSDGQGGLYTSIDLKFSAAKENRACGVLVSAALTGNRLERRSPRQPTEL